MTTSAPKMRTVCQLTGDVAGPGGNSALFHALNEADQRIADGEHMAAELERLRDENRELKTRVEELEAELVEARGSNDALINGIAKACRVNGVTQ